MDYPDNSVYAVVAYSVASVVVLVYAVSLFIRVRKTS